MQTTTSDQCDFGKFKRILLTPNLVIQTKRSSKLSLNDIRLDEDLIKSVYRNNPNDPDKVIAWMAEYSDLVKFNILVCGGDGSVGWILESMSKFNFKVFFLIIVVK